MDAARDTETGRADPLSACPEATSGDAAPHGRDAEASPNVAPAAPAAYAARRTRRPSGDQAPGPGTRASPAAGAPPPSNHGIEDDDPGDPAGPGGAGPGGAGSGGAGPGGGDLPVALASVTVAGQCRERSPADESLFGPAAARFVDRFQDPATGQRLLSRAIADGTAEGSAVLLAQSGPCPMRVSLWRQRGGERIRVVAAFAPATGGPTTPVQQDTATWAEAAGPGSRDGAPAREGGSDPADQGGALAEFAALIRGPAEAALAAALPARGAGQDSARAAGDGAGGADAIAALWRVLGLLSQMERMPASPGIDGIDSEIDTIAMLRRVMRLAGPAAGRAGVVLAPPADAGRGPAVMADRSALWGALEAALDLAIGAAGTGGCVEGWVLAGVEGVRLDLEARQVAARSPAGDLPARASRDGLSGPSRETPDEGGAGGGAADDRAEVGQPDVGGADHARRERRSRTGVAPALPAAATGRLRRLAVAAGAVLEIDEAPGDGRLSVALHLDPARALPPA
ncbi:MAG: hypothetical protein AAFR52_16345 [Pseudomonadota bacterium]